MSRYSGSSSTKHRCRKEREDEYVLSWSVDFYSANSRLRFPRTFQRVTNLKGAVRFCKKWGLPDPRSAL